MVRTQCSLVLTSHPPKADALSRVRGCPSRPGSLLVPVRDGGSHRAVYSVDSLYFLTFEMRRATNRAGLNSVLLKRKLSDTLRPCSTNESAGSEGAVGVCIAFESIHLIKR